VSGDGSGPEPEPKPSPDPSPGPEPSPDTEPTPRPGPGPSPDPFSGPEVPPSRIPREGPSSDPRPNPSPTGPGPRSVPDPDPINIPEIPLPDVPPKVIAGSAIATGAGIVGSQLTNIGSTVGRAAPGIGAPAIGPFIANQFDRATGGGITGRGDRNATVADPTSTPLMTSTAGFALNTLSGGGGPSTPDRLTRPPRGVSGGSSSRSGVLDDGARINVTVRNDVTVDPSRLDQLRRDLEAELGSKIADDVIRRVESKLPNVS